MKQWPSATGVDSSILSQLREQLAVACRIIHFQGWSVQGHSSARTPGSHVILSQRHYHPEGKSLADVTPDDMVQLPATGAGPADDDLMEEYHLHVGIYDGRPDIDAICYGHPPHAVALSMVDAPFIPASLSGAFFPLGASRIDLGGFPFVLTAAAGATVGRALGKSNALLIRGKGLVTVGASVQEATVLFGMFEAAVRGQVLAMVLGQIIPLTSSELETFAQSELRAQIISNQWKFHEEQLLKHGRLPWRDAGKG